MDKAKKYLTVTVFDSKVKIESHFIKDSETVDEFIADFYQLAEQCKYITVIFLEPDPRVQQQSVQGLQ